MQTGAHHVATLTSWPPFRNTILLRPNSKRHLRCSKVSSPFVRKSRISSFDLLTSAFGLPPIHRCSAKYVHFHYSGGAEKLGALIIFLHLLRERRIITGLCRPRYDIMWETMGHHNQIEPFVIFNRIPVISDNWDSSNCIRCFVHTGGL